MKGQVLGLDGTKKEEIDLPAVFESSVNKPLIMKAFIAEQSRKFQLKYPDPMAGKRKVVYLTKQRRVYRTVYGGGRTRTPKKITYRLGRQFVYIGAFAPNTVGGREAHPPTPNKVIVKDINSKERAAALKSAIAASSKKELVSSFHRVGDLQLPLIVEDQINDISKTKELLSVLNKIGLSDEINRVKQRKIRAGKGKMRGRKHRKKVGPLIVTSDDKNLAKSARNLNVQVINVKNLSVRALSHAGMPGRLVIWTKGAIEGLKV
ncbi:MAG: 50S ribosomal protein L4 [Nanoarchaeota archaeon]|nr:50S ribosomal protein L4 [Nanoarchaeota archaeon]